MKRPDDVPAPLLTFMNGCLPRTPLRTLVPALSRAGFRAMTLWPNVWRHARRRDGMSLRDIRALLDDHGIRLTDVDAFRGWVPALTSSDGGSAGLGTDVPLQEFLGTCAELGGTSVVAVHLGDSTGLAREVDGFGALCETAAKWDLRVALEFLAFGGVTDAGHAWQIVKGAGQANAGIVVDLWHHLLGSSGADPAALSEVGAERIFTVQIADAHRSDRPPDLEQAMYHRLLPGDGELDLRRVWRDMRSRGAAPSVGIEVYRSAFEEKPLDQVALMLADRCRAFLAECE